MKIKIILLSLFFLSFHSVSDEPKGTLIKDKALQGVNVNLEGGFYFSTTDSIQNPDNCKRTHWYRLADRKYAKEAFLLISSAYNNNQSISFYISGCHGDYPKVEYVYVGKYQ